MGKGKAKAHRGVKRNKSASARQDGLTTRGLLGSGRFRFIAAFGLSCLGFQALVSLLPDAFARVVCVHTAAVLGRVLNALGEPAVVAGNIVAGGALKFQIVLECTALSASILFACFVAFYPAESRKKAIGLAMGIPALYVGNVVRLVLIFVACRYNPRLFTIVHVYMGQVFTMLLVVLAGILWLRWVNATSAPGPARIATRFLGRFVLISGCMFIFWLEVHNWYVRLMDRLILLGFSFFNCRLFFPPLAPVYYETFSIVAFVSLVLATPSAKLSRRVKALVGGLALLFLFHLFHRVNNALMSACHFTSLLQLDVFICDIGQYAIPVLLWLPLAAGNWRRESKLAGLHIPTSRRKTAQRESETT